MGKNQIKNKKNQLYKKQGENQIIEIPFKALCNWTLVK